MSASIVALMAADPTNRTVTLHPADNVAVVVEGDEELCGHKLAGREIAAGESIVKLGEVR